MINGLIFIIHNTIIFPALFLFYHVYGLFNAKYRKGIFGRYAVVRKAEAFRKHLNNTSRDLFLIHCASMGEFEHIKPFVRALKARLPQSRTVVTFFSPSGYENVKNAPGVDLFLYAPFDWWFPVYRFLRNLRPKALMFAKYDVWPGMMTLAGWRGIPRFLLNATLYETSSRLKFPTRWLLRPVYNQFDSILTISEDDRSNFRRLAPKPQTVVVGDSKYDQVVFRSEESRQKQVIDPGLYKNRPIFVAGSTWPEDEVVLIPALRSLLQTAPELLVIICPHEPTAAHLAQLDAQIHPLLHCHLSRLDAADAHVQVVLIDRIGVLANLYSLADVAYVGGGFKQNVHNVLEPAVYGIPVLFGPLNRNSHEAQLLKACNGAIEVDSTDRLSNELQRLFSDAEYREAHGSAAKKLVETHRGATAKMLGFILDKLSVDA